MLKSYYYLLLVDLQYSVGAHVDDVGAGGGECSVADGVGELIRCVGHAGGGNLAV